jgi:hypothetical protein
VLRKQVGELEKITPLLPSLIASQKCENPGLKASKPVHSSLPKSEGKIIVNDETRATLTKLVPTLKNSKVAEGVGFEPTVGLPLLLISSQVPLTTQPPFHLVDFIA